ncbi:MAG: LysR family transcriptional regulator, transcriptional activator AphB [Massilia sp.]|nr:LysR family transcriptional regulator, transcriptional activator AphB [Massilia sp.]
MMDLNDLALFVQVIRAGSFAEAARRLGAPPNTISRRIQQLESSLGVRLMQRSTRKLVLTDAGRALHERCAEQIESLARASEDLIDGSQQASGTLRVAAPADFFNWFQMEWIAEFLAAHPLVRIEFVLSDARADLISESIDLAFRAGKITEPNLVARQLGTSRSTLVAGPAYLATRGVPLTLADLAEHDCICFPRQSGRTSWTLDGPQGDEEVKVTGRFSASSTHGLLHATLANLGICLLPTLMVAPHLQTGRLQVVLPEYGLNGMGVHFVYLSRKLLPRAVSAFIDFTTDKIQDNLLAETPPCLEACAPGSSVRF